MKSLLSFTAAMALSEMRDMDPFFFTSDRSRLLQSKKFTGARKIQRAAKKHRNSLRNRS